MTKSHLKAFSLAELRTHRSTKWRDFPGDVLPLAVAEMDFPIADPIRELLLDMVSTSDLGYLGAIPEIGPAFADFAHRRWNWEVDPDQVHLATDVGVGVVEVLRLVTTPGDQVLISSPVYHNFSTWLNETHLEKVDVPFQPGESGWELDFESIRRAYQNGVKVHLLCNPHNPLGRLYSRPELLAIATLAREYSVVVISDEIHGPLTYPGDEFVPFLSLGEDAEKVGITVTAASKAWNIAGLKCAVIVSQDEVTDSILKQLPTALHYRASILGAFASVTAYLDAEPWLDSAIATLDWNRHFLQDALRTKLPAIKYQIPSNSYLAWLDLSQLNLGENPAKVILERGRVAILDGAGFGPGGAGYGRLNFATSPEIISEAIDRMVVAIS